MSLRNGIWHGLQNDIIMQNVKYRKWRKELNNTEKHARVFVAPSFGANLSEQLRMHALLVLLLPLAQTNKAEQKVAMSFTAFVSM